MSIEQRLDQVLKKFGDVAANQVLYEKKFTEINRVSNTITEKEVAIFPSEGRFAEDITIIPISDIHLGCRGCNIRKLEQTIELISETPNCYTVLLGDASETATKTSVGMGVYDEEFDLRQQIRYLKKLMKPMAAGGKILGAVTGNHEMRVAYATSINPMEMLCENLDVPYFGFQGYLALKVGGNNYHILMHHGVGGGCTPAGKLNAMRKLNQVALVDLYMTGHTHGRAYDNDVLWRIDEESGIVVPFVRHYIVAGSYMEYWDGYAEMKALPPSMTGSVSIKLSAENRHINVFL